MEAIASLEHEYFLLKAGAGDIQTCIDWAIERLCRDQEGDDREVVLLAGATERNEAMPLVERIVERYRGASVLDEQLAAGKYVASLHKAYLQGEETIESIDARLVKIVNRVGYPDWLVMLSRNCEYATDMSGFVEPFELELAYIAGLWDSVTSRAEFEAKYSRAVSDQHDGML